MSTATSDGGVDQELKEVFERSGEPVLTAVEVAEELGITQQAAHAKLMDAHEIGEIKRKKVGSRAVVWWFED